jgi:hypothetical protein
VSDYAGDDFNFDAFLASSRPALGLCDFELIGDRLFSVGVPVDSPLEFKKMVFAAGKTYVLGNKSIDRVLKQYGKHWLSGSYQEHAVLFQEIAEFVRRAIENETERFRSIPNKADHHGLFMSGCALFRLKTSFSTARFLLRQHYWIELACIEKLIFEQICWSYNVRHLEGSKLYAASPTSAVKAFKTLYPDAGIIYGLLNDIAHISPRRSKDYLDLSDARDPGVFMASAKQTAKCAYLLLFLVDMFQVCSEYVYRDYHKRFLYTVRVKNGGLHLKAKRKTKTAIQVFQPRLKRIESDEDDADIPF